MKARRLFGWAGILVSSVLMLVVWALVIWVTSRPALRHLFDFSPRSQFTVDPLTEQLLQEVHEQKLHLELHTFFQGLEGVPQGDEGQKQDWRILNSLQGLATDLIRRYAYLAGDSVRVKQWWTNSAVDIAGLREASARFGVSGTIRDLVVVALEQPGKPPRFKRLSLVGDLAVIDDPAYNPAGNPAGLPRSPVRILKDFKGEEALSSTIRSLMVQGTPKAYFVQGLSTDLDLQSGNGGGYSQLLQALRHEGFDVAECDLQAGVPGDATVLAVMEPRREFTERQAQALYEWLKHGGRLLLNYSFLPIDDKNPTGGELGRLLGFEIGAQPVFHLVPDLSNPSSPGLGGTRGVADLTLAINPMHPVIRPFASGKTTLQFTAAREIRQRADGPKDVRFDPILRTGPYAWLATPGPNGLPGFDKPNRRDAYQPRDVGVSIDLLTEQKDEHGNAVQGEVIVLSGICCNNIGMQFFGDLPLNIFNWFAERKVLLHVRGERYRAHHFKLEQPQLDAIWWLLVPIVPGTFLLLGVVMWWRRRSI